MNQARLSYAAVINSPRNINGINSKTVFIAHAI